MILNLLISVVLVTGFASAEPKRGLVKPENRDLEVTGVIRQRGNEVEVETSDRIILVDKVQFLASNSFNDKSKFRVATYKVPVAAIHSIVNKEKVEAR